jgi:hypothetical protein
MHRPITRLILEAAVAAVLRRADAVINRTMPLLEAGECWLELAGTDPYVYKGIPDLFEPHVRPDQDGGCVK